MILVMDTYAWIEYFKGTAAGREVEKLIGDDNNSVYTSIITITEVSSIFKRENQNAEKICSIITEPPNKAGRSPPIKVTRGIMEFRNACFHKTLLSPNPLARAVRT